MPWVRARDAEIYYQQYGSRSLPALVLVRGLVWSSRYWMQLPTLLSEDFCVIVCDNRGSGASSAPLPPYTTAQMADDVAAVLDATGIERAHMFGLSLGGMIAQHFGLRHPRRLGRLVLGATSAGRMLFAPPPVASLVRLLVAGPWAMPDVARLVWPVLFSHRATPAIRGALARWSELVRTDCTPKHGALGQLWASAWHDTRAELHRLEAVTLVLTGDADRLLSARHSHRLATALPNARLHVLPGAGHEFPVERPAETAALLCRFLRA